MEISKINITSFRHLSNIDFSFGKILTVIAGGNGTGKTSLLGIVGHVFRYGSTYNNLFNERFETKYSSVFRFSTAHDAARNYKYRVSFTDNSHKDAELRTTNENGNIRHRIDVGGRVRGGGKILKPVIFLSLKRLLPLAQENEKNIRIGLRTLSHDLNVEYNTIYNNVFSSTETINAVHTKSNNKNSFSPTTTTFDSHGISAGQDNIGHIILAILSFKQLKQDEPTYNGGLLLIDELDATLYPAAQKNLLKVLLKYGRELNLQIVFTTHSSDLLNFLLSRQASQFKHSTNFVSLSNSLGRISVKEGFGALSSLLADLNHEVLRTIKPKKINFYFEDKEAYYFFKSIIRNVNFDTENIYKDLSIGCGMYKSLIDKGFEEFFRSIVVLDGDFKFALTETTSNTVVFLPSNQRPENVVKDFLHNLPESDSFWNNSHQYTKRVFLNNLNGVADNRDDMKKWFNAEIAYWGEEGIHLFSRWNELNSNLAQGVISRTRNVIHYITENFYELSINA